MKICLISLSRIADDARVRRQGDALAWAGHDVVGIGLSGAISAPPDWPVVEVDHWELAAPRDRVLASARMMIGGRAPSFADRLLLGERRSRALLEHAVRVDADAYQAHDWWALPFAAHAARANGAAYWYDSHEYAVEQRADSRRWRAVFPPFIRAVEGRHIRGAAFVTTVAHGIAALLQCDHDLGERPLVLRNLPTYQRAAPRPVGQPITVLYHGIFHPGRRLETLIDSVTSWDADRRLVLRGWGLPAYTDALARRIAATAPDRVRIEPPVPHERVVSAAAEADIGVFFYPGDSRQVRHALPNKVFEYVMAGLALCISDQPDMAEVVTSHDVGVLIGGDQPADITAAIHSLSPRAIEATQARSLAAARQLCWEVEREVLLDAVATRVPQRSRR